MARVTIDEGQFLVFGLNREQAINWCRKVGLHPYSSRVALIAGSAAGRGRRLNHEDQIIVLEDAPSRKDWEDIRTTFIPCGVDLDKVPRIHA